MAVAAVEVAAVDPQQALPELGASAARTSACARGEPPTISSLRTAKTEVSSAAA